MHLRIDKHGYAMFLTKLDCAVNYGAGNDTLIVIFENDAVERVDVFLKNFDELVFGLAGNIAFHLMIHTEHLLATGYYTSFDRRWPRLVSHYTLKRKSEIEEYTFEN